MQTPVKSVCIESILLRRYYIIDPKCCQANRKCRQIHYIEDEAFRSYLEEQNINPDLYFDTEHPTALVMSGKIIVYKQNGQDTERLVYETSVFENGAPYRVFLRYLKGCEDTRFLYSGFTGGAVDDCAFSFIYRHLRDRQGQRRMLSKRSSGRLEQRKTGFYYPVDKTDHFLLAVLVIALHNDMHQAV